MNRQELIENLNQLGVKPKHYTLENESYKDSSIVMEYSHNYFSPDKKYDVWNVFRFERGAHNDERTFYSENEACLYVYEKLKRHQEIIIKFNLKD